MMFNFRSRSKTPMIMQAETSECGLACLCMIMHKYGNFQSLRYLRSKFMLGNLGVSLATLRNTAEELNFNARSITVPVEQLNLIKLPAILHWKEQHFVVLAAIQDGKFHINDPAKGSYFLSSHELLELFSGYVLEVQPNNNFENNFVKKNTKINEIWNVVKSVRKSVLTLLLLSVLAQLFTLSFPLYYRFSIDHGVGHGDVNFIIILSLSFLLFSIIHFGIMFFRSKQEINLGNSIQFQSSSKLVEHLFRLPLPFFENRKPGAIIAKVTSNRVLEKNFASQFIGAAIDATLSIFILIIIFAISYKLALLTLFFLSTYALIASLAYKKNKVFENQSVAAGIAENVSLMEAVQNIQTVKLYAKEDSQLLAWEKKYLSRLKKNETIYKTFALQNNAADLNFNILKILSMLLSCLLVSNGEMAVGEFFAIFIYGSLLSNRYRAFLNSMITYNMLQVRADRLEDIIFEKTEDSSKGLKITKKISGSLKLENIAFHYGKGQDLLFHNVDIEISPGELIAITGPSGCGKTTLLKIMLGLYTPTSGSIKYDGINILDYDNKSLRTQIATVMQDDVIISGSILENIAFFEQNPNFDECVQAAKLALVHDHIMNLPMGYNTKVRQGSGPLSGGQKQRILLARALYKKPTILFIDEGTAFLDIKGEEALNKNLNELSITRIVIAHRIDSIVKADRIIAFNKKGRVQEYRKNLMIKSKKALAYL